MYIASEQTNPRKTLPTPLRCWMGIRINPFNLSELIGWGLKHGGFIPAFSKELACTEVCRAQPSETRKVCSKKQPVGTVRM